jgi:hypothetical protein
LVGKKKLYYPADGAFARAAANGGCRIVNLDTVRFFEGGKELLTLLNKTICALSFNALEVAQPGSFFKREGQKMNRLLGACDVLFTDKVGLHDSLAQGLIDGVFRIAQVPGGSLANLAGVRLRQPQVLEDLTDSPERRWRLCRIAAEPLLGNRCSTPVKGTRAVLELFMQTSDTALSLLGPSATATLGPSSVIYGDILVH